MRLPRKCRLAAAVLLLPTVSHSELTVNGVDEEVERNIRAFLALASEPCDAEAWRVRRRFRAVEKDTRKAMEPYGFYQPEISKTLEFDDDCWQARLDIAPGDPVRLRDVSISVTGDASNDSAFRRLLSRSGLARGEVLRHERYESLKKQLQTTAADRGYFEAAFDDSRIDVWPAELAADIDLTMQSGPRYRIGEIRKEQDFLEPRIVDAYIDIRPGDLYDGDDLAKAYRDLSESAYFSAIEVVPEIDKADDQAVPIRISLKPGTRIEYTVGAGVSTDTGARLRAGYRNNRVNRRGHRLISELDLSQVIQGISAEYRIPLGDPRREWFSLTGAASSERTDTFDSDLQTFGVRWTKAMSDTWLRTLALDVSNESFNVGEDVNTTTTVVPAVIFDHKSADRDVFPLRGRRIVAELRGTDKSLGSSLGYLQTILTTRFVRSLGEDWRVLARLTGGYTQTDDFSRLPPTARFFAGGDESVRGFEFDTLGPKDENGQVIGGSRLLVASLEVDRHITGNFYGAVFVDAGNAFVGTEVDAEIGTGFGIKWRSPVGPVRIYIGFPISANEESPRLHLRLGAEL